MTMVVVDEAAVRHPLTMRDFRLLFISRGMSTLSDALVPAVLSLAIVQVTGSATALAIVLGCALGARLLCLPLAGVLADRVNTRFVSLSADLLRVVTQSFVCFELLSGRPNIALIAVAQLLAGVASAASLSCLTPLVAGVVEGETRQKANSLMGVAKSISQLFGPALAGLLIVVVGPGWVFLVDAAAFAVSAAMLALIKVNRVPSVRRSLWSDLTHGWNEVRSRDWYWTSLIAHATWNLVAKTMLTLGPLVAVRQLGGQGVWLVILQAGGIGLLVGSVLSNWAKPKRPVLVGNIALATYAIPLALFAVQAPVPLLVVSYGVALAALGFLNPTWETAVQKHIPAESLARVSSYDWLVSLAAQPIGTFIVPVAIAVFGNTSTPFALAAVLVAVVCLGTALVPGVRNLTIR